MNSGDIQEPANDCHPFPWLEASAPARAHQPMLVLQIGRPLEADLLLSWELLTAAGGRRLDSGVCRIPAGRDGALLALPEGCDELGLGEELLLLVEDAHLAEAKAGQDPKALEIWRRFSNFSLWSESGVGVTFRAPLAGPDAENGFFVTLDGRRVAVDFDQVIDVNLKHPGARDEALTRLTLAPSLGC